MCVCVCVCVCVWVCVGRWRCWEAQVIAIFKDLGCITWVGDPYISVQFTFVWHQKKSLDGSRMIIDYCKLNQIVFLIMATTLYMVPLLEQIHKASDTWYYDHQLNEHILFYGLPWWLRWWRICLQFGRPGFGPWVRKSPREGNGWLPTPVFLPGESHGQRSLVGYSPRGLKESDMTKRLTFSCFKVLFYSNQKTGICPGI